MSRADDLWLLLQDALEEEGRTLSELPTPREPLADQDLCDDYGHVWAVYWVEDGALPPDPRGTWDDEPPIYTRREPWRRR